MTNKEIANVFNQLAGIMELHKENPYKIRSYQNAYIQLRKVQQPLEDLSEEEIGQIKGIGKTISSKIRELLDTGVLSAYKKYQDITPVGVQEMLKIKGFGPKKIRVIWKDLGAESIGELLYACNENRLIELKGFGQKTQEDLKQKLKYFQQSKNKFHYATVDEEATQLEQDLTKKFPDIKINLVGAIRRKVPIVDKIELLIGSKELKQDQIFDGEALQFVGVKESYFIGKSKNEFPVIVYTCAPNEFGSKLFRYTAADTFMTAFVNNAEGIDFRNLESEEEVFEKAGLSFIPPELRETEAVIPLSKANQIPQLITDSDIKSVLHVHTHYSDGLHALDEMAAYAQSLGYQYIGITDHSKSAFYANGLKEDRLKTQWQEIDALNKTMAPFKIFKGIESDILNDGSLDYDDAILAQFDFVIASVHSNLKMEKEKATQRIITAIKNPYTTILGHPTGRLLLSREGYPLDHEAVINACAEYGVVIELNANPYRLDLDWTWIPYALDKGVKISINPDAHSKEGIHHIHYGVLPARKGGLTAAQCFNNLDLETFEQYLENRAK